MAASSAEELKRSQENVSPRRDFKSHDSRNHKIIYSGAQSVLNDARQDLPAALANMAEKN